MFRIAVAAAAIFALVSPWASIPAADKDKADKEKREETSAARGSEPKGVPIELKIVDNAPEAYEVDSRGEPLFKFQEKIISAEKEGELLAPTEVEMELEIKNTGDAPIQIWVSGDATLLTLDLQGNGARTAAIKRPAPRDVIAPQTVTIQPGKTYRMPLTRLAYGFRNEETYAYITEPTTYRLSASFKTGVFPAPKGTPHVLPKGFGEVILKSAPISFRVIRPG